jgi:predicted DNA-binding transcriptional regulator YafY
MPKGTKQKLKLYYLAKIMVEKTDDNHSLTMPEIIKELEKYEVTAERKSLYEDIKTLEELGIEVLMEQDGRNYQYHVGSKKFEIAELKLLVDSIQVSKFITEKKSRELIKKLMDLVSVYEALQLQRQVVVQGRIKTMNESIYYVVDDIHRAISENKKISFEYLQWNINKEMVPRKDGRYEVSPWALTFDDENYYMIAFDSRDNKIKHYRVDKMRKIKILDEKRDGSKEFEKVDMASYSKMNFGMFSGETTEVDIEFNNRLVGVFLDRFGKDIPVRSSKREGWSQTRVEVAVSDQFLGWIFALGTDVKIIGPSEVSERFRDEIARLLESYE